MATISTVAQKAADVIVKSFDLDNEDQEKICENIYDWLTEGLKPLNIVENILNTYAGENYMQIIDQIGKNNWFPAILWIFKSKLSNINKKNVLVSLNRYLNKNKLEKWLKSMPSVEDIELIINYNNDRIIWSKLFQNGWIDTLLILFENKEIAKKYANTLVAYSSDGQKINQLLPLDVLDSMIINLTYNMQYNVKLLMKKMNEEQIKPFLLNELLEIRELVDILIKNDAKSKYLPVKNIFKNIDNYDNQINEDNILFDMEN